MKLARRFYEPKSRGRDSPRPNGKSNTVEQRMRNTISNQINQSFRDLDRLTANDQFMLKCLNKYSQQNIKEKQKAPSSGMANTLRAPNEHEPEIQTYVTNTSHSFAGNDDVGISVPIFNNQDPNKSAASIKKLPSKLQGQDQDKPDKKESAADEKKEQEESAQNQEKGFLFISPAILNQTPAATKRTSYSQRVKNYRN